MVSLKDVWTKDIPSPQKVVEIVREVERELPAVPQNPRTRVLPYEAEEEDRAPAGEWEGHIINRAERLCDRILDEIEGSINDGILGSAQASYINSLNRSFETMIKTRQLLKGEATERSEMRLRGGSGGTSVIERIRVYQREILNGIDPGTIVEGGLPEGPDGGHRLGEPVDS